MASELTHLRTTYGKMFKLGKERCRAVICEQPLHYYAGGKFKDIDLTFSNAKIEKAPYELTLHNNDIGFDYRSRDTGSVSTSLVKIDGTSVNPVPAVTTGNRARYLDVRPGLDIVVQANRTGVQTFRILKGDYAPRSFTWLTHADDAGLVRISKEIVGHDALHRSCQLHQTREGLYVTETWTGQVRQVDPVTRIASWTEDVAYPVCIDPDITEVITIDNDDGHQYYGIFWVGLTTTDICGRDSRGYTYSPGWRFTTVAIPQGATITLANLKLNVTGSLSGGGGGTLWGNAADSSAAFGSGSELPKNKAKTSASVSFPRFTTTGIQTIDVTTIIQEIVNRAGWVSNNNISLFVLQNETTNRNTQFEDSSNTGTNPPTLEIDFVTAGGQPAMRRMLEEARSGNWSRMYRPTEIGRQGVQVN